MTNTTKIWIGGISALARAASPAALALGASGWLGFVITAHGLERIVAQEKRRAIYVAAEKPPNATLKIEDQSSGAVRVDRADVDGRTLTVYLRNRSHERQCFQALNWALRAPDGTLIAAGHEYIGDAEGGLMPGDRAEGVVEIKDDPRAVVLRLTTSSQDAC